MRLTRRRRRAWACGHRGFGASCNRCSQANDLETKANDLAQHIKTKAKLLPSFVESRDDGLVIRAGGQHVFCSTNNSTPEAALTYGVGVMREHATRLLKPTQGL